MKIPTIENVHVDSISDMGINSYAIGWSIADARFHVWVKRGEIGETIYKNPPLGLKSREPGYFETRQLDRTSKVQAGIFAAVMAIVERDGLVAKAVADHAREIGRRRRQGELEAERAELEVNVLKAWRAGRFDDSAVARAFLVRANELDSLLDLAAA